MKKTKTTQRATETQANNHSSNIAYDSLGDMANDVRGVLKAIINKDGQYSTQEASVISKIYNAELTRTKLLIEVHKLTNKTNKTSSEEILRLNQ
tara:strand:+ start:910 stop:1191 length:282 start_codon:yes stop_codon:yes gene_type:complete